MRYTKAREHDPPKRPTIRFFSSALLSVLVVGAVMFSGCSRQGEAVGPAAARPAMTVPVMVATAAQKTVPVEVHAIGNVQAYSTVTVKSQVDGEIEQVHFKEGQDVSKGDLLFTIDPRPFQAQLDQAEANLARDQAQAKNAVAQAGRYKSLYEAGIVSKDQYDQFQTNSEALAAAVRADQAAVETAKLNLNYCTIISPLDGRTGDLLIHAGNLVKSNDTSLLVINQIRPIYISFSVPEQYLPEIKKHMTDRRLAVLALYPDQKSNPAQGVLSFVNNTVDSTTGTILLKATFSNADRRLWPGQFVNVALRLTSQENATVVPSQAVQTGEKGDYVYVVKPDKTAEFRPVQPGTTFEGETVIEKGVQPGETVVTDGQLALYPGAKVEEKSQL
jgi:membrane fusion protein, multidrug efflux system